MKNYILSLLLLLSPALILAQEPEPVIEHTSLVFNEVQVANIDQYLDGALCYGSWIELYNPTS